MMDAIQQAPSLPTKSNMRSSRFLEPIDTKAGLDEQPPLSPSAPPHDVYLSSEEDASSSADDFSDYDFESDSEEDPESPNQKSHQDTARIVSFVFYGKPALVDLPPRSTSPSSVESQPAQKIQRTSTDPDMMRRRTSVSSTASSSILSTFSRSSTYTPTHTRRRPSFLSIDPFATKSESELPREAEGPRTPKGASSMLKRTFSLARKRSKPHLNQAATQSQDVLALRPASVDQDIEDVEVAKAKETALKAARRKTTMIMEPPPIPDTTEAPRQVSKGHSRLRSGLSISMGRRRA